VVRHVAPNARRARNGVSVWARRLRRLADGPPIALIAVALVAITSHATLIWHHAVPDFDTDTFINRAAGGCDPNWIRKGMGDTAHPLGNALIPQFECVFHGSGWPSPAQAWYLLLTIAVVVIIGLLWAAARSTGAGDVRVALAVAYLGMSPAMRTMSTRANEKWIGVTLFLVVVLAMLWFHRSPRLPRAGVPVLVCTSTALGLWHTQYLIILGVALGLWGVIALISPERVATTRAKALTLGASVLVPPAAAVGVMSWTGYVTNVAYQEKFLSIFNDNAWHGPVPWTHDFLAYTARWLPGWLQDDGAQEVMFPPPHGAGFVLLGLAGVVLFVALAVSTRNSLLCAIAVGCLALPFLYEPDNAERWDAVSVVLALCLAVGGFARDRRADAEGTEAIPGSVGSSA
jgi:hypothetical protein